MKTKKPVSYESMLNRMAGLCAAGEQCTHDLREKMMRGGLPPSDCERALRWLEEHRFVDDSRYAGSFARDKVKFAGWGALKIRAALAVKRIPQSVVAEALASIGRDDYLETLERVAESKARGLELDDYQERVKLIRRLASRGFEPGLCMDIVETLRRRRKESEEE